MFQVKSLKRAVLPLRVCIFWVYLPTVISMNFGQHLHYHNNVHNESNWTNIWLSRPPSVVELKLNFFTTVVHQRSDVMIIYDESVTVVIFGSFLLNIGSWLIYWRGVNRNSDVVRQMKQDIGFRPKCHSTASWTRVISATISSKKRVVRIVLSSQLVDTLISPGIGPAIPVMEESA